MSKDASALSAAPSPATPGNIRNVVLVGPSGSGKSGVLAQLTGVGVRDQAREKKAEDAPTAAITAYSYDSNGTTVTVLDTPGQPDFVGEVRAGLRAADAAIFVISALDHIDGATSLLWQECAASNTPRAIVITKLDLPNASFDRTVAACRRSFGVVQAIFRPEGDELIDLVEQRDPDVVESIIEQSEDETLLDRYLSGEEFEVDALRTDARTAIAAGRYFPVVPVSFTTGKGIPELQRVITYAFTSPDNSPLPRSFTTAGADAETPACDPDGDRKSVV